MLSFEEKEMAEGVRSLERLFVVVSTLTSPSTQTGCGAVSSSGNLSLSSQAAEKSATEHNREPSNILLSLYLVNMFFTGLEVGEGAGGGGDGRPAPPRHLLLVAGVLYQVGVLVDCSLGNREEV